LDLLNQYQSFNINDSSIDQDMQALQKVCPSLHNWGRDLLTPLVKGSVKSIIFEPNYVCKDHRNLYSHFYSKKYQECSRYTSRLHFFNIPNIGFEDVIQRPEKYQDNYVGYTVIRPVEERCIGRTIIDPNKLARFKTLKPYCLATGFTTHIGGRHFSAHGYPYISQDKDVTVCAHTALWGVCRFLSEKYSIYKEIYPFDIIELTDLSFGRTFPYRAMTYLDYSNILSRFGTYPWIMRIFRPDPKDNKKMVFSRDDYLDLCTYIESGFPVLASYAGHVITLIGHTIDYSKSPVIDSDGFIDSSSFYKHFIVMDDNFPPYQLLGDLNDTSNYGIVYGPADIGGPQGINMTNMQVAVCPLPEKVFLTADKVRMLARKYFAIYKNTIGTGSEPIVLRLFLTTNTSFQRRKLETIDQNSKDVINYSTAFMKLPHFIWVMEAGPLSLYLRGKCTSEIVMDSTANPSEATNIYMRVKNLLIYDGKVHSVKNNPEEFSQYTHNLGD
jgi:hypothetical protein